MGLSGATWFSSGWRQNLHAFTVWAVMLFMAGAAVFGWSVVANEHLEGVRANSDHQGGILDYVSFHAAARMVREGDGTGMYDLDAIGAVETETVGTPIEGDQILPYLNPPFVAVALAPMAGLPLTKFVVALMAINACLFAAAMISLQSLLRLSSWRQRAFLWLFGASLFSVFAFFLQQQLTLWIALAWLGFVASEMQGKQRLSGAALALGLVKPQMILLPLLFLLYHRRWRTLAWFSVVAVPLVIVSFAVVGPEGIIDYPRLLLDSTAWETNGVNARQMFGWNGLIADVTGDVSPPRWLLVAFAVPTIAVVAQSWRRASAYRPESLPGLMALALTASLLVNPHLYFYDMTLAALALALGAVQAVRSGGLLKDWHGLAMIFWITQLPLPGASYNHGFPLVGLATVGLFALLWASARTPGSKDESVGTRTEAQAA